MEKTGLCIHLAHTKIQLLKVCFWAGGMAQWLRIWTALAEGLGSTPNTHTAANNYPWLNPEDLTPSGLQEHCPTWVYLYACREYTHIRIDIFKKWIKYFKITKKFLSLPQVPRPNSNVRYELCFMKETPSPIRKWVRGLGIWLRS